MSTKRHLLVHQSLKQNYGKCPIFTWLEIVLMGHVWAQIRLNFKTEHFEYFESLWFPMKHMPIIKLQTNGNIAESGCLAPKSLLKHNQNWERIKNKISHPIVVERLTYIGVPERDIGILKLFSYLLHLCIFCVSISHVMGSLGVYGRWIYKYGGDVKGIKCKRRYLIIREN